MKVVIFGATGRVGQVLVTYLLQNHHTIFAFVRSPDKVKSGDPNLNVIAGDIFNPESLSSFEMNNFDALINVIGADPLKPSTTVTESARVLTALAESKGILRYLGITGIAEMPKTFLGKIVTGILRRTPVGNAIKDHDGAISIVRSSKLEWMLVGCPHIVDGKTKGQFNRNKVFPGGFRTIHPGDVAKALLEELEAPSGKNEIVGIWY